MQRHLLDPNVVEALTVTDDAVTEVVIIDHDGEHRAFSTDEHYAGPFKSRAETISRDYGERVAVFSPAPNRDRAAAAMRRGLGPCEAIIAGMFSQCLRCGCVAPLHHIQKQEDRS